MARRWAPALVLLGAAGCVQSPPRTAASPHDEALIPASYQAPEAARTGGTTAPTPDLSGPQPVEAFIRRALAENRTVQAAYHNVRSLRYRIPQVTALDDPVASNVVFPIPSVAPQYSLMGYNPYTLTLAQQFPWCGTLRVRGEVADRDVRVALAELAAAQLDAVAAVKRAYYDLHAGRKVEAILAENRKLLEDFRTVARQRVAIGGAQADAIRSEILINELDREAATNRQAIASAEAALARQVHAGPDAGLQTLPELTLSGVPAEIGRLYELAIVARPELKGRLAAVARDEKAVELAEKRSYPNVTLGLTYMDMEKTNAVTPRTASGTPNVGLFVAFNLPINRDKYRAGVCEARERALADARLYEAQRDESSAEIKDLFLQSRSQQESLALLRDDILPRTRKTMDLAASDYAKANVDYATLISALREVLRVQLQVAQAEAELGKSLALLERAVGCQINEHPPEAQPAPAAPPPDAGPFEPSHGGARPGAG